MKLYIKANQTTQPFNIDDTGVSYYNDFLTEEGLKYMQSSKNLTGEIVYMSPDEYIDECVHNIFHDRTSKADLIESRMYDGDVDEYAKLMKSGTKFPLCYLNYADDGQEGLHRMLAAQKAFGPKAKYPVLVVNIYDEDRYRKQQLLQEMNKVEYHELADACEDVKWELTGKFDTEPDNLAEIFKEEVEKTLHDSYNIDDCTIDVEILGEGTERHIACYLSSYKGLENPAQMNVSSVYVDELFAEPEDDDDDIDFDKLVDEDIANMSDDEFMAYLVTI